MDKLQNRALWDPDLTGDGFRNVSLILLTLSLPSPTPFPTGHKVLRGKQSYLRLKPASLGPYTLQASTKFY